MAYAPLVDFSSPGDLVVGRTEESAAEAAGGEGAVEESGQPRGLALRRLVIDRNSDGPLGWLTGKQHVFFLSVAFDASGQPPVVMPPQELSALGFNPMHEVPRGGGTVEMTLGDGAPIFLPRTIVGGLAVYVLVCEADSLQKVAKTLEDVHSSVTDQEGDLLERVKQLVTRPGEAAAGAVLSALTTLLLPIAAVLKNTGDDFVGLVQGTFPATRGWDGRLVQDFPGGSVALAEV